MWSVWMLRSWTILTVAELIAVNGFAHRDVVLVVMVNIQTNVIGDDPFSPGVGYCVPLD